MLTTSWPRIARVHLKGCLHTHTTCSDGRLTAQEVADRYLELGYDFIAFTDHDHLERPDRGDIYAAVRSELLLFIGVELTVFVKGYMHVNRLEGESERIHILNHPANYRLEIEELRRRMEILHKDPGLDAVEVTCKGMRTPEYEELAYPGVATDDSHARETCGKAWIELDCARNQDAILRAVRAGDFWNCYAGEGS